MAGCRDEERALDVVYLHFSKAFTTVSPSILTGKAQECGLDEGTVRWDENWWNGSAQRDVLSGTKSTWRPVASDGPQG